MANENEEQVKEDLHAEEQEQTVESADTETTEVEQDEVIEDPSEKEKEDLRSRLLRTQADYDNFRRRTREEQTAAAKYRSQNLAEKLLPVLDNFERALQVQAEGEETQSLLQGMEIVHRQLKDALEKENIKEIEAEGKPFDPEYHQAVMQAEGEDGEPNTVVEVMQKGYMLGDRVLRPAMVKVTA